MYIAEDSEGVTKVCLRYFRILGTIQTNKQTSVSHNNRFRRRCELGGF